MKMPSVEPGQWILVGRKRAVVCRIYSNSDFRKDSIEVVYLDRNRAINEDVCWKDDCWTFVDQGPAGGYADHYPGLSRYVRILRAGYPPPELRTPKKVPYRRGKSRTASRSRRKSR